MALVAACVLCVGSAAGGTVAWLIGQSQSLTNTFTPSTIQMNLQETETGDGDEDPNTNSYTMVPGAVIAKDPRLTVRSGSEAAWVFVYVEQSANFNDYLAYEMADGWTALEGQPGVYWRETPSLNEDVVFSVIRDDAVTVLPQVTAAMLNQLTTESFPTLTITGYAVQRVAITTPADAWALARTQNP